MMRYVIIFSLILVIVISHLVSIRSLSYDMTEKVPMIALINDHAAWLMRLTINPITINYYSTIISLFTTALLMFVLAINWRVYVRDIRRGVIRAEVLMRAS